MEQVNTIFDTIKDKVFFSRISGVMVDVVQEIPEQGDAKKAYFDGMTLLDCLNGIEDDIQQVTSVTKQGRRVNLEDYYHNNGAFEDGGTERFIAALNQLMTREEWNRHWQKR